MRRQRESSSAACAEGSGGQPAVQHQPSFSYLLLPLPPCEKGNHVRQLSCLVL